MIVCIKTVSLHGREFIKDEKYNGLGAYLSRRLSQDIIDTYFVDERCVKDEPVKRPKKVSTARPKVTKQDKEIIEKENTDG